MPRRAPLVLGVFAVLAACGADRTTTPPADASPRTDRVLSDAPHSNGDRDGDGLCDDTEAMRRTDPTMPDTDGDGLLDSFEVHAGTDPLSGREPLALDRVLLREGSATFGSIEHVLEYRGGGEVLVAAMQDRAAGVDDRRASDLVDFTVEATTASPAGFVRDVVGPRFVGVVGDVVLSWRVTARLRAADDAGAAPLGCRRAYETQVVVKREGSDVVQTRRLVVEVAPPEGASGAAWPSVSAEGLCLPSRCL